MKKSSTFLSRFIRIHIHLHQFVIVSCLALALTGEVAASTGGWMLTTERPVFLLSEGPVTGRRRRGCRRSSWEARRLTWTIGKMYLQQSWRSVGGRSGLLLLCWWEAGALWVVGLPWLVWGWQLLAVGRLEWQRGASLARQLERLLLIGGVLKVLLGVLLGLLGWLLEQGSVVGASFLLLGTMGCVLCDNRESGVQLGTTRDEQGTVETYTATLCGHFELAVSADDFFRRRLLILFLRLLEVPGHRRKSRRTRDGRTPIVRQQALAAAYGVTHPEISRWEGYWQRGDWRRLLSLHSPDVLTMELQARIIQVFAHFPWWGVEKVCDYLQEQGVTVNRRQVRQAAAESGWSQLRQELTRRYHLTAESVRPKDEWIVTELLAQVQRLLVLVETGQRLPVQEVQTIADVMRLTEEVGIAAAPSVRALPWGLRLEQLLFGQWELVQDEQVRCLYCGSSQVARKSAQPRMKRYYDETGAIQEIAVYRYYCRHAACEKGSFTQLPPGLLPYSPYRLQTHLLALQMTMLARTNYRRAATALAVAPATLYRWVVAGGNELLPVAALFGFVRCSGVVGIDEKYVLVPKNDKPQAKMRRWMYVSVAVDCYTYDLLHIAIHPYRTKASSHAFLLALRAKGYQPRVIVTDLWADYEALLAAVFPNTLHHHCIFHALQAMHRTLRKLYGADYRHTQPEVLALQKTIDRIFQTRTRRTAHKRYQALLSCQQDILAQLPDAAPLFDFLQRYWPTLVNGIQSKTIPRTNNAAELVIRRFDQHYQTFCGFDTLASAQLFLAVFEKVYRFTPFSQDAKPHLRGKCPLQLAGYDITQIPLAAVCTGWSPDWSLKAQDVLVPNL